MAMSMGRDRSRDGNANTGVYSWLCDRSYRAIGIGAVTGCLVWVGAVEGGRSAWRLVEASYSDVAGNLRWLWDAGTDSWLGPARWCVAVGIVMVVWFLGVGAVEWWRGRQ